IAAIFRTLLGSYLAAPLRLHLGRPPAERLHKLTTAIDVAYRLIMGSLAGLFSEALVTLALTAYLVAIAPPAAALAAAALVLGGALVLIAARASVAEAGRTQYEAGERTLHEINEVLGGIREIKVGQRELEALDRASGEQRRYAGAMRRHLAALATPRVVLETGFALGAIAVIFLVRGAAAVPLLALFAWIGLRLIPAANRVVFHLDHIRHGAHAVAELDAALTEMRPYRLSPRARREARFRGAIEVDRVWYAYPGATRSVLRDASLTIRNGEWIGLTGENGSGKSTLLDVLAGLLEPDSGSVRVDGRPLEQWLATAPPLVGYVSQRPYQFHETGSAESGGERQRADLDRALAQDPEILLLDEPTTALDPAAQRSFAEVLASLRGELTLVLVSHDARTLALCDRVVRLREGTVVEIAPVPVAAAAP
ncbi:MAG TPA: ATP-binding cassette domain-containing protein, partial [Thermoanaerobaculia bacterium]|nr:ATP-binding cassette domain-containing protein [Thermoanaerobaculia bacterium]